MTISRRELLLTGASTAGVFALAPAFLRHALAAPAGPGPSPYGELGPPDLNGVQLPPGFTSKRIASARQPVGSTPYALPIYPDGQATYKTSDGGWVLVTNSESAAADGGGVSAIRFSADGSIADAYRICGNTTRNCAGGPTPWGTWLTGEEAAAGLIWECDPAGKVPAVGRPAMGAFAHEAAAVDRAGKQVYLSEDDPAGGFYRFTPTTYPDLSAGLLEVAQRAPDGTVSWHTVPDPTTAQSGKPTRQQVALMTPFNGGEGLWHANGVVYFTTKGDKKVWSYTPATKKMEVLYDHVATPAASLDAVDNVTVSAFGDVLVCEDGGNLEIGLITPDGSVSPLVRFSGPTHLASELCGVVFSPDQTRMYVTSQRESTVAGPFGAVYEISGPFRLPPGGIPADFVYGPPAGEGLPDPTPTPTATPTPDTRKPVVKVKVARRVSRKRLLNRGLVVKVASNEAAQVAVVLDSRAIRDTRAVRPPNIVLGRSRRAHPGAGAEVELVLKLSKRARKQLAKAKGPVAARVLVSARDAAGNDRVSVETLTIGRAAQQ